MTHYLLLKFTPGAPVEELFPLAEKTFAELTRTLECMRGARVLRNCVERDANADMLVILELTEESALKTYLEHPLHQAFAQQTGQYIAQRVSLDTP